MHKNNRGGRAEYMLKTTQSARTHNKFFKQNLQQQPALVHNCLTRSRSVGIKRILPGVALVNRQRRCRRHFIRDFFTFLRHSYLYPYTVVL